MGDSTVSILRNSSLALRRALMSLHGDERGQATVEYILILSVAVVGAATIARQALRALDRGILNFGGQLEKDLKTGRASLGTWTN